MKFRECGELLDGRKLLLKMKERIFWSCVQLAMLHRNKIWCLQKNGMAILKRIEKAMIRAMCRVKLIEKRSSQELMDLQGLAKILDKLKQTECYGMSMLSVGIVMCRVKRWIEKRSRGRLKMTWRRQMVKQVRD